MSEQQKENGIQEMVSLVSFPFKNKRYVNINGILKGILLLKNIFGIRERNPLVALSFHELHTQELVYYRFTYGELVATNKT